ncbi:helix-turn-helix transcriptional regulator [Pedobacter nutrimenti]|uniref:helix-turn-helix domain-containing protein n=1 Tax=Pedobacter nutrimenti TaxID=1241337 RepID=UPI00292CFB91|nr:helix-turn-helix transcriptional regulator [Pedobacter nutrimenti]
MKQNRENVASENVVNLLSGTSAKERKNIALALGIAVRTYQKIENGQKEINLQQLCKIAEIFKVRRGALVTPDHLRPHLSSPEKLLMLQKMKDAEDTLCILKERIESFRDES